jgi:hypothetical protein
LVAQTRLNVCQKLPSGFWNFPRRLLDVLDLVPAPDGLDPAAAETVVVGAF